ncbi:hypothetical protein [Streptomyces scopuliridis]|uniref:Uncharacterized protein n=1 Tax=Streptomyces scopuliridis RB72 TaxID=1440053 RepID=A0A2T7SN52_9ACTN|nr:hypothetical protein [Streptomyces scopuliridis]PVE04355.1 hypothetical protein Y717_12545 [Streptomyces scopuliridis RB72]
MSDYQYYEFCAADRALDRQQLAVLRTISTRGDFIVSMSAPP